MGGRRARARLPGARNAPDTRLLGMRRAECRASSCGSSRARACRCRRRCRCSTSRWPPTAGARGAAGGRAESEARRVTRWPVRWHVAAWLLIVLVVGGQRRLLAVPVPSALVPYVDALIAWGSVFATWLVARKVLENWLYWIVIDLRRAASTSRRASTRRRCCSSCTARLRCRATGVGGAARRGGRGAA